MRINRYLIVAIVLAMMVSPLIAQVDQLGARPLGAGGAYTAMSADANSSVWNPASMESFRNLAFTASFARLYLGVENDGLNEGFASLVNHLGLYGQYGSYGISFAQYFSDVYSQMQVTLGYGKRLYGTVDGNQFSVGANLKLLRSGFNDANFYNFDPTDEVFSSSYNSMSYSADAGLFFRPANWISVGAVVQDLLQPDVSISGSGEDADKLPMKVRGGLAFHYKGFHPTVDIEYAMREINGESDMKIHAGIEKWFGKTFAVRAGLNRDEAALGLSYMHFGERLGWGIDYAVLYPALNEMASDFLTTHRVAVNLTLDPPPEPIRDLELSGEVVEITPKRGLIGGEVEIRTIIENRGEIDENGVRVAVYYQNQLDEWNLAVPVEKYDFGVAERVALSWKWTPPAKGHYTIFVNIDDKGDRIPDIRGRVPEDDESNNTGMGEFDVFLTPEGNIKPRDEQLKVSKLTLYQEEEPLIPVVFYGKESADVAQRYDGMLATVAERLKTNPDVLIYLRGYYDELSEPGDNKESLAISRARGVETKLKAMGAPAAQVKVIDSGYFMGKSRAGNLSSQWIAQDKKLMSAENRRVELSAWFPQGVDFLAEVSLNGSSLGTDGITALGGQMTAIQNILNRNPEAIILVESFYNSEDEASADQGFKKAMEIGRYIRGQLGEDLGERIKIHTSFEPEAEVEKILVFPNSEGVIWRPKVGDRVFTDYQVEGTEENLVEIDAAVDAGVDSFGVVIVNEKGDVIRTLAYGKGEIPSGLAWDWRDNSGELLDFDNKYFAKLDIRDNMGETFLTYSDTMEIQVTHQAKRIESLVIVLFRFDEDVPESKFLETRVEYVARRFIERADKKNTSVMALVTGHADSIGPEYDNIALSKKRSERELNTLKNYMMYQLDFDTKDQLDKWLSDRHVTLEAKGFGESKPYEILRWTGETVERVLLGDNAYPEGRTVNRRVLLEVESRRITE
ncbi:conjugal transfer protein TraF [bacterium]|nr:conjugal transfer protein TraF [bacterium]